MAERQYFRNIRGGQAGRYMTWQIQAEIKECGNLDKWYQEHSPWTDKEVVTPTQPQLPRQPSRFAIRDKYPEISIQSLLSDGSLVTKFQNSASSLIVF